MDFARSRCHGWTLVTIARVNSDARVTTIAFLVFFLAAKCCWWLEAISNAAHWIHAITRLSLYRQGGEREITCLCQLMHTHVSIGALVPLCVRCVLVFNLNNLPLSFTRVFLFRSFFFLYSFFFSFDMCVGVCGYVWLFCVCVCGGGGGALFLLLLSFLVFVFFLLLSFQLAVNNHCDCHCLSLHVNLSVFYSRHLFPVSVNVFVHAWTN